MKSARRIAAWLAVFVGLSSFVVANISWAEGDYATSKDYCAGIASQYQFPEMIQDGLETYSIRPITQDDKDALLEVLRSKCMLDSGTVTARWDGKSEAEREAFFSNYAQIKGVVTKAVFDKVFPKRRPEYTWESFLKSAVAFPYLCGEDGESVETCKREFATMFAHWLQETSGLLRLVEGTCDKGGCASYLDTTSYFYNADAAGATPDPAHQYFGRGPKQLSYNYNYGRYSWQYFGDMRLSENPSMLIDPSYIEESFVSAFWFYMTPVSQKPSMHAVVTGIWKPNAKDTAAHIAPGFGATINIINGARECGKASDEAANRIAFYVGGTAQGETVEGTLKAFGLDPAAEENLTCTDQSVFPLGGSGSYALYYNHSPWWQCELTYFENLFTLYDKTPYTFREVQLCGNGLDCCQKVQKRLKEDKLSSPPLELETFAKWFFGKKGSTKAVPIGPAWILLAFFSLLLIAGAFMRRKPGNKR